MKKLVLLLISIVIIAGCFNKKINQNDNKERIYLSSEYYNKGEFLEVDNLDNLSDKTYIVFTYNNFCNMSVPCEKIFESFMEKYSIDFLKISFENFKNSPFYNEVKYAPSVIIINNEKIISYLDANKDDDLQKYQDEKEFEKWLNNYIYFNNKN